MDMKKGGKRGSMPIIGTEQITGGLHKSTGEGPITNSPLNGGHVSQKEMPMGGGSMRGGKKKMSY